MADLAAAIRAAARRNGVDENTALASAIVESNLNPNARGDGGTSYNLWQEHQGGRLPGGALGNKIRSGDAMAEINWAVPHFKGGSGGAFAASVQRPADRAGYARKVDAVLAQLRAGKMPGGSAYLNAPVSGGSLTGASTGMSGGGDRKAAALSLIFGDDPVMSSILAARPSAGPDVSPAPVAAGPPVAVGKDYHWIQQMGEKLFGLRNDPGNSQTTGGKHTDGSEHYKGRAVDFGNARNTPAQLAKWQAWAKAHGLDVLNEGDHIHVSLPGGGT